MIFFLSFLFIFKKVSRRQFIKSHTNQPKSILSDNVNGFYFTTKKKSFSGSFLSSESEAEEAFCIEFVKGKKDSVGKCNRWLFLLEKNGGTENSH